MHANPAPPLPPQAAPAARARPSSRPRRPAAPPDAVLHRRPRRPPAAAAAAAAAAALSLLRNATALPARAGSSVRVASRREFRASKNPADGAPTTTLVNPPFEVNQSLYFDNVFPLKWFKWDLRSFLFRPHPDRLREVVFREYLPPLEKLPYNFSVRSTEPRAEDGGLFVHYKIALRTEETKDPATKAPPASKAAEEITSIISKHLRATGPWYKRTARTRVFQVKGKPFLQDMLATYPTSRLKIEFLGPDLTMESLYHELRPFGKLADISIPPPSKDGTPRFAIVQFALVRSAAAALNCIHNDVIGSTRLSASYHVVPRTNMILNWLVNHPRVTIPILAAGLLAIFYAVFDPIRVFFVTNHITKRYNIEETSFYKWLRRHTLARLPWGRHRPLEAEMHAFKLWHERTKEMTRLRRWLTQPPETFMVLTGPKGSGKSGLIGAAIKDKKHQVVIQCSELINAKNNNELLRVLAKQVGYYPVLAFTVNLSNMVEGVVAATTGQKAGIGSSDEMQFTKILECVAIALHNLRPDEKSSEKDVVKDGHGRFASPDDIPVVVIDDYDVRELKGAKSQIWDQLANWASLLVENRIAHVVFITTTVTAAKPLSKALPNRTLEAVTLADASPATAVAYLRQQLKLEEKELPGLGEAVDKLGGRATDLEIFLYKMRTGLAPEEAINDLIFRAVIEVRKHAFGDELDKDTAKIPWTPMQFWDVAGRLATAETVHYDAIRFSPIFGGDEKPIQGMEAAGLIQIIQKSGRPYYVRASRPLYRAAFQQMMSDPKLSASMKYLTSKQLFDGANASLEKVERELAELGRLFLPKKGAWVAFGTPPEIVSRIHYLLGKVKALQGQIESFELEMGTAKKTLEA